MKWILNLSDMLSSLDDELNIAERVASDLGGTIRKIYVSDKE